MYTERSTMCMSKLRSQCHLLTNYCDENIKIEGKAHHSRYSHQAPLFLTIHVKDKYTAVQYVWSVALILLVSVFAHLIWYTKLGKVS